MPDREIDLIVTRRRARAAGPTDAARLRVDDLWARRVILKALETRTIELGITEHDAGRIDQRDAAAERGAGRVGERIRVEAGAPLGGDDARLALEAAHGLVEQACLKPVARDGDDAGDQHSDEYQ